MEEKSLIGELFNTLEIWRYIISLVIGVLGSTIPLFIAYLWKFRYLIDNLKRSKMMRKSEGCWLEPYCIEGQSEIKFSYTQIHFDGEKLKYTGYNYDKDGIFDDVFKADFIGFESNIMKFEYNNINQVDFGSGIMELVFFDEKNGKWTKHKSKCFDYRKREATIFHGRRATVDEEKLFEHSFSPSNEKAEIIQECISDFEKSLKEKDNFKSIKQ